MALIPCLVCGELAEGSRCGDHRRVGRPGRPARRHGDRGYDWAWRKLSAHARRRQPFCADCGATEDLQADHSPEAWRRRAAGRTIRLRDIAVVCGSCNRARGASRGGNVTRA